MEGNILKFASHADEFCEEGCGTQGGDVDDPPSESTWEPAITGDNCCNGGRINKQ